MRLFLTVIRSRARLLIYNLGQGLDSKKGGYTPTLKGPIKDRLRLPLSFMLHFVPLLCLVFLFRYLYTFFIGLRFASLILTLVSLLQTPLKEDDLKSTKVCKHGIKVALF